MVTHLFFVDDSYMFWRANSMESNVLKAVLDNYAFASGHVINYNKLSITFSKNVDTMSKEVVSNILGIVYGKVRGKYWACLRWLAGKGGKFWVLLEIRWWGGSRAGIVNFCLKLGEKYFWKTLSKSFLHKPWVSSSSRLRLAMGLKALWMGIGGVVRKWGGEGLDGELGGSCVLQRPRGEWVFVGLEILTLLY